MADSIQPAGDAVPARPGLRAALARSTTSRCGRSGRSSTGSTTSRTRSTARLSYPLVVPDGHLRQLRHERRRRAEADLRHVPHRLRARARSESSRCQLPRRPRPGRRHRATSWRSCRGSSRGSSATTTSPSIDGEYLQTPGGAGRLQAVQHVHQLHALLRRLPGLRPRPGLHRPGGHRAGRALRPRLPRPRDSASGSTCSSSTRASGAAPSSASAPGCAPSTSTRRVPSSATS